MFLRVNDCRLYFDVEGVGLEARGSTMVERPKVLLLHGGPGHDHSSFKPEFAALTDSAQLIYLDLRGNGRSDFSDSSRWNLDQWAADVDAFLTELGIEQRIILGQSFGGEVALHYATKFPEKLHKLMLLSVTGRLRMDRSLKVFERLGGERIREIARRYWEHASPEAHEAYYRECLPFYTTRPIDQRIRGRAVVREPVARHYNDGEAKTYDVLPQLHRVRCRTLILAGTDDPITTIEDAEDIATHISPELVEFVRLEGARHGPVREAPEKSLAVLRRFIRQP